MPLSGLGKQSVTQASAWVTYMLLAIGMIGPVVCVVWLTRTAVENENAVVRRLMAEADERTVADAEALLRNRIEEAGEEISRLGIRFKWNQKGSYSVPAAESERAKRELGAAREVIAKRTNSEVEEWLMAILQDEDRIGLRLAGGRPIGPIVLELGLEKIGQETELNERFLQTANRYVLAFIDSDAPESQKRYLLDRYGEVSNSESILNRLDEERRIESWYEELTDSGYFPPEAGMGRTSEYVHVRKGNDNEVLLIPIDTVLTIASGIQELEQDGVSLNLSSDQNEPELDGRVVRRLAAPLDIFSLGMTVSESGGAASSEKATLYIWICGIVLSLSLLTGGAIVFSIWRQASVTELKNNLVSTVTHELKTPVSSIRLLVDTLLEKGNKGGVDVPEYLELISRENERLGRLIDNFLSFSRMERNKASFLIVPVTAKEIVDAAELAFRDRFLGSDYSLNISIEEGIPKLAGDRDALATVLGNLFENAYKYGDASKRIELSVTAEKQEVVFEVRDYGRGISRKDTKRIFRKFYRAESDRTGRTGSVGLGLAIVDFIVSKHSGCIELDSEIGKGSTFKVRIPYA